MKLNIFERIYALSIIDSYREGNFITYKMIKNLRSKLLVTEEESKEFDLKLDDDKYTWNEKGSEYRDIDITEGENKLMKDQLVKLDKSDKLLPQHISLYEKFVGE